MGVREKGPGELSTRFEQSTCAFLARPKLLIIAVPRPGDSATDRLNEDLSSP